MKFTPNTLILTLAFITSITTHASELVSNPTTQSHHINTPILSDAPLPKLESLNDDAPLKLNIPKMERFTTTNGVRVMYTQLQSLPIVDITIDFKGGSALDSSIRPNGYGIANMAATMMTQGTMTLDENAFAERAELLGAAFGASAYRDTFSFSLRSLSNPEQLEPALVLFTDMIQHPRFDAAILKRNQAQAQIAFEFAKQSPAHLGNLEFIKTIYGTHPYAIPSEGTEDSVATITRDDLLAYQSRYLVAGNAHITITGDISRDKAHVIAEKLSHILPAGARAPDLPTPTKPIPRHIHIPFDSSQTHVLIGHLGLAETKDRKELQRRTNFSIGNGVLAGNDFNAHLMKQIRDEKGYTYGISGGMTTYDEKGFYRISFSTQNERVSDAITDTLAVIERTRRQGVSNDEFTLERTNRQNAYPMSLDTNSAIHAKAAHLGYDELPDSYITDYLMHLDNATLSDVNTALKDYIHPDEFIIITIGGAKPDLSHLYKNGKLQSSTTSIKKLNQQPKKTGR